MTIISPCGIDRAGSGPRIVVAIVGPLGGHLGRSDPSVGGFRGRGAPSIAVPLRFSGFGGGLGGGFRCRCRGPLAPRHETHIGDITQIFQIAILVSGAITYHGIERFPAAAFSAFGAPRALFEARAIGFARCGCVPISVQRVVMVAGSMSIIAPTIIGPGHGGFIIVVVVILGGGAGGTVARSTGFAALGRATRLATLAGARRDRREIGSSPGIITPSTVGTGGSAGGATASATTLAADTAPGVTAFARLAAFTAVAAQGQGTVAAPGIAVPYTIRAGGVGGGGSAALARLAALARSAARGRGTVATPPVVGPGVIDAGAAVPGFVALVAATPGGGNAAGTPGSSTAVLPVAGGTLPLGRTSPPADPCPVSTQPAVVDARAGAARRAQPAIGTLASLGTLAPLGTSAPRALASLISLRAGLAALARPIAFAFR